MDHTAPINATPPSSRKRSRENETESQRNKREKAAERQRRKRERDRQAGLNNLLAMTQVQQQVIPPPPTPEEPVLPPEEQEPSFSVDDKTEDMSPDEQARREKVRAAARERQRKHRALVKQKKLRELGLDMGNELMPGMEDVPYRLTADGQYQVPMHEMQQHAHGQHPHNPHGLHEPPFPQGQPLGGQTFASTLLLSFSCAPLLKAHLLRTLNMTNEELASLEPIIAQAWDHWDQQRRMHYAQNPGAAPNPQEGQHVPDGSVPQYPPPLNVSHTLNHAAVQHQVNHQQYVAEPQQGSPNDFRARFHRSLVAPSPFQQQAPAMTSQATIAAVAAAAAASVSAPPQKPDTIDPSNNLDPQLGQARDEAVGVAKQLERS